MDAGRRRRIEPGTEARRPKSIANRIKGPVRRKILAITGVPRFDAAMTRKLTGYMVVSDVHPERLNDNVNALINDGYEPLGGVAVAVVGGQIQVFQAMTKYGSRPGED